ncbi:hypothetical protein V7x_10960 [Crateriforma conspicua]|uniref:Uncharacterized protein n=1 Tax=Crateriforma conspicua TaxID=2527996 RepID=A0A5C6FW37_9PLAN|nr:hypothetical protein V7x_10960 [Crateriforma conspicua]
MTSRLTQKGTLQLQKTVIFDAVGKFALSTGSTLAKLAASVFFPSFPRSFRAFWVVGRGGTRPNPGLADLPIPSCLPPTIRPDLFLHTWTRRIALIAYLVGGWLMPAAHHHGHGKCVLHAVCSDGAVDQSGCGCEHGTVGCDDSSPSALSGQDRSYWRVATAEDVCHGLCTLCVVRGMSGSHEQSISAIQGVVAAQASGEFTDRRQEVWRWGASPPRGPPAKV